MRFREYPLLNTPNLMAIILREASAGPATLARCAARLQALLARADEHPPFGPEEVASRLEMLIRYLAEARLISRGPDGSFALTERGRAALAEHPQGFDTADLMVYPEFARYIRGLERRRGLTDARAGGYDEGYYAYWTGENPADNPYNPDSARPPRLGERLVRGAGRRDFRSSGPRAPPLSPAIGGARGLVLICLLAAVRKPRHVSSAGRSARRMAAIVRRDHVGARPAGLEQRYDLCSRTSRWPGARRTVRTGQRHGFDPAMGNREVKGSNRPMAPSLPSGYDRTSTARHGAGNNQGDKSRGCPAAPAGQSPLQSRSASSVSKSILARCRRSADRATPSRLAMAA